MYKNISLSLGIDAKQFYSGLIEICTHLEGNRSDEYMNGLIQEVRKSSQSLFDAIRMVQVRQNVLQESRMLNKSLAGTLRYIESFCYVPDDSLRASAEVLKQLFKAQGKSFTRMNTGTRMAAIRVLLRELNKEDMQAHVKKLPELTGRLGDISNALETLETKQREVDLMNSKAEVPPRLLPLKREARGKLAVLVSYLDTMSIKEPKAYDGDYDMVMEVIKRMNAIYRAKVTGKGKSNEDQPAAETQLPSNA